MVSTLFKFPFAKPQPDMHNTCLSSPSCPNPYPLLFLLANDVLVGFRVKSRPEAQSGGGSSARAPGLPAIGDGSNELGEGKAPSSPTRAPIVVASSAPASTSSLNTPRNDKGIGGSNVKAAVAEAKTDGRSTDKVQGNGEVSGEALPLGDADGEIGGGVESGTGGSKESCDGPNLAEEKEGKEPYTVQEMVERMHFWSRHEGREPYTKDGYDGIISNRVLDIKEKNNQAWVAKELKSETASGAPALAPASGLVGAAAAAAGSGSYDDGGVDSSSQTAAVAKGEGAGKAESSAVAEADAAVSESSFAVASGPVKSSDKKRRRPPKSESTSSGQAMKRHVSADMAHGHSSGGGIDNNGGSAEVALPALKRQRSSDGGVGNSNRIGSGGDGKDRGGLSQGGKKVTDASDGDDDNIAGDVLSGDGSRGGGEGVSVGSGGGSTGLPPLKPTLRRRESSSSSSSSRLTLERARSDKLRGMKRLVPGSAGPGIIPKKSAYSGCAGGGGMVGTIPKKSR